MKLFTQAALQSYRRKYKAISLWVGKVFVVGIADANQACVVLKSSVDKNFIHDVTKDFVGNGSVFAPVEFWHRRRKILAPTFAPRYVNEFVPVFQRQSKVAVEQLESRVGKGNFSSADHINVYGLDSVCETMFGVNMNMQRQPDHPFLNAVVECLENIAARICQPWLFIEGIYKRLPEYARQQRRSKILNDFVYDIIHKVKDEKERNNDDSKNPPEKSKRFKTFIELMIDSSKETDTKYTDEELREEILVLSVAGSDTSAVCINFALLLLSQHNDVQDKVCQEIHEVLGDSDKSLQAEDLLKLKYTRAVIKETLRLYPPVPFIGRQCKKELELPTGIILPEDCHVIISLIGIHRNPEHWGEDANDFNPDRFMTEEVLHGFMPFSHGPRNCIGQKYAMLSITTTLVTLLRRYRFTPATNFKYDREHPPRLSYGIMLKHVENYPIQIEYRNKFE